MTSWCESNAESATFLAIRPPDPITDRIVALQGACGASTFYPHITVKAQPGLAEPDRWLPALQAGLARVSPFEVRLGPPTWFGSTIVYLSVRSAGIVELHHRILALLDRAGISERFEYDGEAFVAHLTLGADFAGADSRCLRSLATGAAELSFPSFVVDRVWAFHRSGDNQDYTPWRAFPFGAEPLATTYNDRHED